MENFDHKAFDWKQAVYKIQMKVTEIDTKLTNHLNHHKWTKGVITKVLCAVIIAFILAMLAGKIVWK